MGCGLPGGFVAAPARAGAGRPGHGDACRVESRIIPVGRVVAQPRDREAGDGHVVGGDCDRAAGAADGAAYVCVARARAYKFQVVFVDVDVLVVSSGLHVNLIAGRGGVNRRLDRGETSVRASVVHTPDGDGVATEGLDLDDAAEEMISRVVDDDP